MLLGTPSEELISRSDLPCSCKGETFPFRKAAFSWFSLMLFQNVNQKVRVSFISTVSANPLKFEICFHLALAYHSIERQPQSVGKTAANSANDKTKAVCVTIAVCWARAEIQWRTDLLMTANWSVYMQFFSNIKKQMCINFTERLSGIKEQSKVMKIVNFLRN